MAAKHCDQCGRPFGMGRRRVQTVTGRSICQSCADELQGAAAGVLSAKPGQEVPNAVSVSGWFARLRRRRRSKPDA